MALGSSPQVGDTLTHPWSSVTFTVRSVVFNSSRHFQGSVELRKPGERTSFWTPYNHVLKEFTRLCP